MRVKTLFRLFTTVFPMSYDKSQVLKCLFNAKRTLQYFFTSHLIFLHIQLHILKSSYSKLWAVPNQWLLSIVLRCYLAFLSVGRLCVGRRDYVYVRQAVLRHELVTNSMLTNQHYTSNKVSLKRNTHKTRLYIDQLKICDERLTVI